MPFQQGQIVRVEVFDPRHRNSKIRPALILTPTEEIHPGGQVVVIAIPTSIEKPLPPGHFLLPWAQFGRARTGLSKPSVLKCDWVQRINVDAIRSVAGSAPTQVVIDALKWLRAQRPSLPGLRWR